MRSLFVPPLLLLALNATAQPLIISDSITFNPPPTHCGWYIDAAPKEVLPVALDTAGKPYCSRDMKDALPGQHSLKATFIIHDAQWGDREGAQSAPFSYTVPSSPSVTPAALRLVIR